MIVILRIILNDISAGLLALVRDTIASNDFVILNLLHCNMLLLALHVIGDMLLGKDIGNLQLR